MSEDGFLQVYANWVCGSLMVLILGLLATRFMVWWRGNGSRNTGSQPDSPAQNASTHDAGSGDTACPCCQTSRPTQDQLLALARWEASRVRDVDGQAGWASNPRTPERDR